MDIAKQRDFLLQESKQVIKEAKITTLNEMAHISGKLQTAIDSVIEAYPELDGLELKRKIKSDVDVIEALDDSELYENQLNKYIALKKGRRELKKRGRKPQEPNSDQPLNEMAKIQGSLKDAMDAVISSNPELSGLALKKAIKADEAVKAALDGEVLHDNQLNRYIASFNKTSAPTLDKITDIDSNIEFENEEETVDDWNSEDEFGFEEDEEPKNLVVDKTYETETISDPTANSYKNIIVKKVNRLENTTEDQEYKIHLQSLKNYIKRPEVIKALGRDLINNLVSPIIG